MTILLITTATWSCAERIAGALGAGGAVEAVFPSGHVVGKSRFLQRAHPYRPLRPLGAIRQAIAAARPALVIPCEDRAADMLGRIYEAGDAEERALLERSLGAPERISQLYNRRLFTAEAAKAGVPTAGMLPAPDADAVLRGIDCLGLPLVIKSDNSYGGEGVVIAGDKAEALDGWRRLGRPVPRWRQIARAARRRDPHFLAAAFHPEAPVVGLQRFIAGRPATSSFSCWNGQVLAANHFDVEVTRGQTGPATVLTRSDCAQMDDAARRIAAHFGLSGLVGLDFIRDENGQVHLLEINPRATPTSHLALGPGHDPCGALLEVLGSGHERAAVTEQKRIALFPQEWRRAPDSPWFAKAYHDVPRDDPAVALALLGEDLNDDPALDLAEFLGPKAARKAPPLTIRQAAR